MFPELGKAWEIWEQMEIISSCWKGAANLKEELETEKVLEILSELLVQNTEGAPGKVVKSLLGGTSLRPGCQSQVHMAMCAMAEKLTQKMLSQAGACN